MTTPRQLDGLAAIASEYDDFIVDLWGVIHDGERPFVGVVQALEELERFGDKRVLFVTNTSRLGDAVRAGLVERIGIAPSLFHDVVSSGDVTRTALHARDPAVFAHLPPAPRCFHEGDAAFVPWLFAEDLGLGFFEEARDADLVVASGAPRDAQGLVAVRERLAPAARRDVPLVCTNPDRIIPGARGTSLGPGAVAAAYEELGGRVFLYGKPRPAIYEEARRRLGSTRRTVAIGDLLETDIRGARDARIPCVLVTGSASEEDVEKAVAREGVAPDMRIPSFSW